MRPGERPRQERIPRSGAVPAIVSGMTYRVQYTVEARATIDALPVERRELLERALGVLARDPYHKTATAPIGPDEHLRKAYAAPGVVVEFMVADHVLVVVVLQVFDELQYLIEEADAR